MFLEAITREHLGDTPVVRCRHGSARRVLVYRHEDHTPPITKQPWKFADTAGQEHLYELLGSGQFAVIEGPHAKSRQMNYWLDGGLVDHLGHIPLVNFTQVKACFEALHAWGDAEGYSTVRGKLPGAGGERGEGISITALMSPHLAPEMGMLTAALDSINLDDPQIDYDTFINLLRAICAACGGSIPYMAEVVWPWICKNQTIARGEGPRTEERGIEWLEERWRSFHDSQIGADYVFTWAASFGFTDGIMAIHQRETAKVEEMFNGVASEEPTDSGADRADARGAGPPGSNGGGVPPAGGPIAFPYTDLALADLFVAQHPDHRYTPDQGWVKLESGVFVPSHCVLNSVGRLCSAVGDPYRAQGAQRAQIDVMLKSTGKHEKVERMLRAHPAVFARPEDFDNEPWLLNTPGFIIDLRNGDTMAHGMLMRDQTAVTPDLFAYNNYEQECPKFLEALRNMAEDDQDMALLARHGAAGLVGTDLDQLLLFVYGQGGTGKSAFSDILMRIEGSYGTAGSTTLFMKQNDKRGFEVGDIAHARSLFVPETLKGMSWDDALVCSLLGGTKIRAEQK